MHVHTLSRWRHGHHFTTGGEDSAERRTRLVLAVTLVTMVAEIVAGTLFNSMALLADGWHMSTHAGAMAIAVFAYGFARRHADDSRFTFGTGKVGALGGFTSAIILCAVALVIVWESIGHLWDAPKIAFDQALMVAVLGLVVNLACALILGGEHDHHDHGHAHEHEHEHEHEHDHNLRAAYVHVLADAVTSILAIAALLAGKYAGLWWLDPVMGLVGAAVIANWSRSLLRQSGSVLLDYSENESLREEVRAAVEADADNRLSDLHLWQVGPGHWSAILAVVSHTPREPAHYKTLLSGIHGLSHVTVEVLACPGESCC